MTRRVEIELSESVWTELKRRSAETGTSLSRLVDEALCETLGLERHTLFQVSTSNALAQGVFSGAVTVGELKIRGDFGVGTFAGLDGELILIDGVCFRAGFAGDVVEVDDDADVPFALVTRFAADVETNLEAVDGLTDLGEQIDALRPSENVFASVRVDATFDRLVLRAACPARPGEGLLEATRHQSEYSLDGTAGTLVGFWAPDYARAVGVPGYHFHFISDDRRLGGHVLDLSGRQFEVGLQIESGLHLAIPETAAFLSADLSGDHAADIEAAETKSGVGVGQDR